jgi:hypothetical protein
MTTNIWAVPVNKPLAIRNRFSTGRGQRMPTFLVEVPMFQFCLQMADKPHVPRAVNCTTVVTRRIVTPVNYMDSFTKRIPGSGVLSHSLHPRICVTDRTGRTNQVSKQDFIL